MIYYSTLDVCRLFEIPRERLREWMSHEFFRPSQYVKCGRGEKALFNQKDLEKIHGFKRLIEQGIKRKIASSIIQGKSIPIIRYDPEEDRQAVTRLLEAINCSDPLFRFNAQKRSVEHHESAEENDGQGKR